MRKANIVINMLARRQLVKLLNSGNNSRGLCTSAILKGGAPAVPGGGEFQPLPIKVEIGDREVVGWGINGEENYCDTIHAPFPAIRFKEDTPEILKIKEKEKGDWKKMTLEEKKALYRHSFCQTICELHAPTGEWKKVVGISLFFISFAVWGVIWLKMFVYDLQPTTITNEEHVKAQVKRMIDMRVNPIQGFSSKYDYEKNEWKE